MLLVLINDIIIDIILYYDAIDKNRITASIKNASLPYDVLQSNPDDILDENLYIISPYNKREMSISTYDLS